MLLLGAIELVAGIQLLRLGTQFTPPRPAVHAWSTQAGWSGLLVGLTSVVAAVGVARRRLWAVYLVVAMLVLALWWRWARGPMPQSTMAASRAVPVAAG